MPDRPRINAITPATPKWGDTVTLDYDFGAKPPTYPTAYVQGFQDGILVSSDGGYPLKTSFQLGPTTAADETQPAEGYACLNSFDPRTGKERQQPLAEFRFPIAAA